MINQTRSFVHANLYKSKICTICKATKRAIARAVQIKDLGAKPS